MQLSLLLMFCQHLDISFHFILYILKGEDYSLYQNICESNHELTTRTTDLLTNLRIKKLLLLCNVNREQSFFHFMLFSFQTAFMISQPIGSTAERFHALLLKDSGVLYEDPCIQVCRSQVDCSLLELNCSLSVVWFPWEETDLVAIL